MTDILQDICYLRSLDETICLGKALGRMALPGDVLCLDGDLGAGKTTLTQQIAAGLDIPADCYVTSPSFSILHEYIGGRLVIYHMDLYRLQGSDEVLDMGLEECFYRDGVTVIEWSRRAADILPQPRLEVYMRITVEGWRELHCRYRGTGWRERLQQLFGECGLSWHQTSR